MQILVVHSDAEVGEQLVQMVKDYTGHDCDLAMSETSGAMWGSAHERCRALITQLDAAEINGLRLGATLSDRFPGLQTMFLPAYPKAEQRLEIADTKVFPEPIDGELLLNAIDRAAALPADAPDLFHVLDVLQMCCLSRRSGAVQVVQGQQSGIVFLRDGKIVHAESARARGTQALFEISGWEQVEFAYEESVRAAETITLPWDEALITAVKRRQQGEIEPEPLPQRSLGDTMRIAADTTPAPAPKRRLFGRFLNR